MEPANNLKPVTNDQITTDRHAPVAQAEALLANVQDLTLNGYTLDEAIKMRQYFRDANKDTPKVGSVYFSKAVFGRMIKLLELEGNATGIRIYFARTGAKPTDKNTVLMISTIDNGDDPGVPSGKMHQDYFKHDADDDLYKLAGSPGTNYKYGDVSDDTISIEDATLYNPAYNGPNMGSDHCKHGDKHYLPFSDARDMVGAFVKQGSGKITTNAVWFDIDFLKELNDESIHEGIRIYFARETRPNDDEGRETFIIVTTEKSPTGTQADYHDCRGSRMGHSPALSEKAIEDLAKALMKRSLDGDDENGEVCPTHCDCASPLITSPPDECS